MNDFHDPVPERNPLAAAEAEPVAEPWGSSTRSLPHAEPARLGALLHGLEPRLRSVAVRFTHDPEAARDVVQNAFEKVLRHGHRFRGHSRVSTWVHRIVVNEALMWLRSERRHAGRTHEIDDWEATEFRDPEPDPFDRMRRRETDARLRKGLEELQPGEREILTRCTLGGRTYAECGAEIGLHPGAVKSRAFRARRRLAALLAH